MPGAQPLAASPGYSSVGPGQPPIAGYPPAGYSPAPGFAFQNPPNLSWGLELLFGFLTCGLFIIIYDLIQASWLKRIVPASRVLFIYIAALCCYACNIILTASSFASAHHGMYRTNPVASLFSLAYLVLLLVARFTMRSELEQHYNTVEPVGLRLGGVMTFFFGGLYFQYHFNRINDIKQAMGAGGVIPR